MCIRDSPLFIRETSFKEIKKELARTAAETVKDGESIFLDSSSTTGFMIPFLTDRKQLKIVTNGAQAVLYLTKLRDARIFCTGGRLRENSLSSGRKTYPSGKAHGHHDGRA